jgi:hypothetical protein
MARRLRKIIDERFRRVSLKICVLAKDTAVELFAESLAGDSAKTEINYLSIIIFIVLNHFLII